MKFKMSHNVSVRTDQYQDAVRFYSQVIGFEVRSQTDTSADLDASPLTPFCR